MLRMRNIVGEKVRQARKEHDPKLTQAELAIKLQLLAWKIDRSGVAKIEAGLRQVTDMEVVILAKALSVPVAWFFEDVV